jgi:hypothetical protein
LKTVPPLKSPKPALDFEKAGLEGLPRPGNTAEFTVRFHQSSASQPEFISAASRFQFPLPIPGDVNSTLPNHNGASSRILNGPGTKSRLFEGQKKCMVMNSTSGQRNSGMKFFATGPFFPRLKYCNSKDEPFGAS